MNRSPLYMACIILAAFSLSVHAGTPATRPVASSQAELDKQFEKTMSNAVLAGSFTITGRDKPPAQDRYTLGNVTKKEGSADLWIFMTTIEYGGHHIQVPLEIPVKWAGDTAVITVDNVGIPGLGQYTARVMIFNDQYVGIWGSSDGSHGGQMWGKIEHPAAAPPK